MIPKKFGIVIIHCQMSAPDRAKNEASVGWMLQIQCFHAAIYHKYGKKFKVLEIHDCINF